MRRALIAVRRALIAVRQALIAVNRALVPVYPVEVTDRRHPLKMALLLTSHPPPIQRPGSRR